MFMGLQCHLCFSHPLAEPHCAGGMALTVVGTAFLSFQCWGLTLVQSISWIDPVSSWSPLPHFKPSLSRITSLPPLVHISPNLGHTSEQTIIFCFLLDFYFSIKGPLSHFLSCLESISSTLVSGGAFKNGKKFENVS